MSWTKEIMREQLDWCRVALTSIGDAVLVTDAHGRVTFMNPVAETLTGWPLEEAASAPSETVFRSVNEDSRRPVENPATQALREAVVVELAEHTLLLARDGPGRSIEGSATPLRDAQEDVAGVVLIFRDVSERRRLERSAADARTYAENIVATVREPLLVLGADLKIRTANRSFYEDFHVTPEETEDCFLYDLGNGQWNIPALRTLLAEILPQHSSFQDFEVEHSFPTLGRRTMLLNARHIRRAGNHTELILLAIEDVTERRRAAARLQISEARYRRLFETAQDGILILDAGTGEIIDANPFVLDLLGYSLGGLLGRELWEIGLFQDQEASRAAFRQLQAQGYIRYEDLPLETRDGKRIDVEFVSNVYGVDDHQVIQCNIRNISTRKRAEEVLKEAERRKDEFLAMLAHELRNPLAPIRNALHLIRMRGGERPQWARQAYDVIERQVEYLVRLVDDLLDVNRITLGKIQLQKERLDLATVVARAVESSRPLIDARRHTLEVTLPKGAVPVEADRVRLTQVLWNLLNNAAKYTPEGGRIALTVEGANGGQPPADQAVVRVRDTGMGIPTAMLPRVFDLFTQIDRTLDRADGGLGIGLTLVRRLTEMHGGTVQAFSEGLGQGSEFVVRLPLLPAELPAAQPGTPASTAGRATPASGRRILVVDDNRDSAETLAMLLRLFGHCVQTAYDGPLALAAATAYLPEVVLLDIGLPGMDGLEVCRRLRGQPGGDLRLIAALTGYGQDEDRRRSQQAGFNAHLIKPVALEALQELLARPEAAGHGRTAAQEVRVS
jgi:PAS domain S-box-containing protein